MLLKRDTGEVAGSPGLIHARPDAVHFFLGHFATHAKYVADRVAVSLVCLLIEDAQPLLFFAQRKQAKCW